MNSKELKKFLEAQKLQTYYLLNKNESFVFFNGIAKFKMKYNEDNILLAKNLNYPYLSLSVSKLFFLIFDGFIEKQF